MEKELKMLNRRILGTLKAIKTKKADSVRLLF